MTRLHKIIFTILVTTICVSAQSITRKDMFVSSTPGLQIFVREVKTKNSLGSPILLIHGARVPSLASFDLPVANGSLAEDLAKAGHTVYLTDARGYGRSTRLPEMSQAREKKPALVRSNEVVQDIATVVTEIQKRTKSKRVAMFGWATGGHWAGQYAAMFPDNVSHIIILNSLYGATSGHTQLGPGSPLEDPQNKGRFNQAAYGSYRLNREETLTGSWDTSIPIADKTHWYDPALVAAYKKAAMESDPTTTTRTPHSFRSPAGAMEDSFYLASGRQFWDASLIKARVFVIRGELDFWSRPDDLTKLAEHLVHAEKVETWTIPQATHFIHLDRPERGRTELIKRVAEFLK